MPASRPTRPPPDVRLDVLLAEDDDLQRGYLALELERLGCRVVDVDDGPAALAHLQSRRFDVLVTDWQMPGMNGLDLIHRLRQEEAQTWLHIVLITAGKAESLTRDALEAGADDFLRKPLDQLQLELVVSSAHRVVALRKRLARRNARLAQAQARTREAYRRLRADMEAAAELQRRLLPAPLLEGPIRYAWVMQPSLHLGGDALGVVRTKNGRILFFHVDVSGHGVPAALGSFMLHNRLSRLAPDTPEKLVEAALLLNREILALNNDSFATLVLVLLESGSGDGWLLRAGHPLPLHLNAAGGQNWVSEGGPPIGLLPKINLPVTPVTLAPGDRLLLYSDGVTEGPGPGDGPLDEAGLAAWFAEAPRQDLSGAVAGLANFLQANRGGRLPEDDISMLMIERAEGGAA